MDGHVCGCARHAESDGQMALERMKQRFDYCLPAEGPACCLCGKDAAVSLCTGHLLCPGCALSCSTADWTADESRLEFHIKCPMCRHEAPITLLDLHDWLFVAARNAFVMESKTGPPFVVTRRPCPNGRGRCINVCVTPFFGFQLPPADQVRRVTVHNSPSADSSSPLK